MKTLKEDTLDRFRSVVGTSNIIIENSNKGLTYYELRQFLAILLKQVSNAGTKSVLDDLLKTVSKLEILHVPVPVIKKQKSVSPPIFP